MSKLPDRQNFLNLLDRLPENVASQLALSPELSWIKANPDWIASDNLRIAIIGEFNRGKSSLFNEIIGQNISEISLVPKTQKVVEFTCPQEHPLSGITLVDTPGFNSADKLQADIAYGEIPSADVVLFCIRADIPMSISEKSLLDDLLPWSLQKVRFVITFADKLEEKTNKDEIEQRLLEILKQYKIEPLIFWTLSKECLCRVKINDPAQFAIDGVNILRQWLIRLQSDKADIKEQVDQSRKKASLYFLHKKLQDIITFKQQLMTASELELEELRHFLNKYEKTIEYDQKKLTYILKDIKSDMMAVVDENIADLRIELNDFINKGISDNKKNNDLIESIKLTIEKRMRKVVIELNDQLNEFPVKYKTTDFKLTTVTLPDIPININESSNNSFLFMVDSLLYRLQDIIPKLLINFSKSFQTMAQVFLVDVGHKVIDMVIADQLITEIRSVLRDLGEFLNELQDSLYHHVNETIEIIESSCRIDSQQSPNEFADDAQTKRNRLGELIDTKEELQSLNETLNYVRDTLLLHNC